MSFYIPDTFKTIYDADSTNGVYHFIFTTKDGDIIVDASDKMGWEHVTVSTLKPKYPSWETMSYVKSLFWDEEDCVVQYHLPPSKTINHHKYCLHLWRPIGIDLPQPDMMLLGR